MKYDTGMKHLHGDILAAVRLMLYHDTEITKKFSPSDGSPAPLREYLKKRYIDSGRGTEEAMYDCYSNGMTIFLNRPLSNENDHKIQLSWSQLTVFIRNNWDEVFKEESDFPCDGCGHDKNGCCDYPETKDDYCELGEKRVPAESVPPTVGETQTAFDYTLVTAAEADKLRECEAAIRRETAGYFTTLGEKFKEAQELLANNKNGAFEKWYVSLGFKRQTVYNLIQRYDFIYSPTVGELQNGESVVNGLPLTLSYEISKPSAPPELVHQVLEGDITTNAEYQKLKKELEESKSLVDFYKSHQTELNKENQDLRGKYVSAESRAANAERERDKLKNRPVEKVEVVPEGFFSSEEYFGALENVKSESEKRIKKLLDENMHLKHLSSIEKSGKLENEIEDLKKQLDKQKSESKKAWGELAKANYELETNGIALKQVREEKADLESKIKALEDNPPEVVQTSDSRIKHFLINITIDDMEKLIELVENSGMPLITGAVKNAILLHI